MFDVGVPEMVMLAVLAVVLFGPERLPEFAKKAARVLHYLRGVANNAQSTLRSELGPEFENMDIRDLNPRAFVQKHLLDEVQPVIDDVRSDFEKADEGVRSDLASVKADLAQQSSNTALPASAEGLASVGTTPFDPEAT